MKNNVIIIWQACILTNGAINNYTVLAADEAGFLCITHGQQHAILIALRSAGREPSSAVELN